VNKPPKPAAKRTQKPATVWDQRKVKPRSDAPQAPAAKQRRPATKPASNRAAANRKAPTHAKSTETTRREIKYYGIAACMALWERRAHDIIRVYLEEPLIPKFTPLLRWTATKRKAYHIVGSDDLERLTESIHHQGICILARERSPLEFEDLLGLVREDQGRQLMVYLDGVENPHNFGAILRTCAHYGVRFILGAEGHLPKLSGAACRVAEGGAEQIGLVQLRHPTKQLHQLQELGFQLLATAGARGRSLYQHSFTPRTLLIMGAETQGVSGSLIQLAQQVVKIPGSGQVESLNVSVAFAVCASEYYRQQMT